MMILGCGKSFLCSLLWLILIKMAVSPTLAADITVDASVVTRAAISVTATQQMSFGIIEYDPSHDGSLELATDGSISLGGSSTGLNVAGGSPAPAQISLNGDGTSLIEVSCMNTGTLSNGSGQFLNLQNVEIAIDAGVAFGSGSACNGLGTSISVVDLSINAAPIIFVGGEIDLSNDAIVSSASYSTTSSGGSPVTLRFIYQ